MTSRKPATKRMNLKNLLEHLEDLRAELGDEKGKETHPSEGNN
jgi:hypothetical protein